MKLNPGEKISIHDIPSMVRTAFPLATTPNNIQAGFKCSGIWPFNPDVFEEHEYSQSQVTTSQAPAHEELPSEAHASSSNIATSQQLTAAREQDLDSGTLLGANTDISPSAPSLSSALASNQQLIFSPETLRPSPQAASTSSGTPSNGAVLCTDTPVKAALEETAKRRKSTVKGTSKKKLALKKVRIQKQNKPKRGKRVKQRRVTNIDSSDDEPENYCLVCMEHFNNSQP